MTLTATRTYRTVTVGPDGTLIPQIGVETITVPPDPAAVDLDETARLAALEHPGDWSAFWRSIRALYPEGRKPAMAELAELGRRWLSTDHWGESEYDPLTGWSRYVIDLRMPRMPLYPEAPRVIAHAGTDRQWGGRVLHREGDRVWVVVLIGGESGHEPRDLVEVAASDLTEF
jgi:hypothetical protein